MRKICVLILFSLLTFSATAQAGYGETRADFPLFIKEATLNNTDQQTYYLLRHVRGRSTADGKFLLVDQNLNIMAETPYVYNLYARCTDLKACYFFNFGFGPLPKNTWQLTTPFLQANGNLLDLYGTFNYFTKSQVEIKAEQKILTDFLNDPAQKTLPVSALEKSFTRGATFSNLKPAPAWFAYAVPFAFALTGAFFFALFFWPLKKLKNLARKKRAAATGKAKTAYTILMLFAYAVTIASGITLALLAFYAAPILYAWVYVLFLGFFGFGTTEVNTPKTAA